MILRYDGSLSGYLCLLGRAVKERLEVNRICRGGIPTTADLFDPELQIETERDWAAKVAGGLERRLGKQFLTVLGQALFSEAEGIEVDLLLFTRRALRQGRSILTMLSDPLVNRVNTAALQTARERHRLLGLLRFSRLADSSYLARIEPRSNIVPLLGSHFSKRLGEQRWLILDMKRQLGIWGEQRQWQLVSDVDLPALLPEHDQEEAIVNLWRSFYHNISNADRFNPKLRQQFMPQRYWKYLTELQ